MHFAFINLIDYVVCNSVINDKSCKRPVGREGKIIYFIEFSTNVFDASKSNGVINFDKQVVVLVTKMSNNL